MKGEYRYKNQPLEVGVAKDLIIELFAGKSAHRKKISEKVLDTHIKRKGKLPKAISTNPVYLALSKLKKESLATPLGKGIWAIVEENVLFLKEDGVQLSFDFEAVIGEGANSVYVYYYPIYRLYAESQDIDIWACKVGHTKSDPHKRIKSQSSTAMPEPPKVGLVIKTDEPEVLENVLHNILKLKGKFMKDAPGKEWFITSPSEVQQIYNRNF
jgi:hypothetical protein